LRTETFDWPEQVIDLARNAQHRQLPHVLAEVCDAASGVGRYGDAVRYGLEAIALNDDDDHYDFNINSYWKTGFAIGSLGEFDQALSVMRVGAEHPADHPVRSNLAYLNIFACFGEVAIPEHESAEAIAQLKASPMPTIRGGGFWVQGMLAANVDVPAAIAHYRQAIEIAVESGSRILEESVRGSHVGLMARTDDVEAALTGFTPIVDAWQTSMGDTYTLTGMAELVTWLARLGYSDGAARLAGVGMRGEGLDTWTNPPPELAALPEVMGEAEFAAAYEAGAALDFRAAGELAHQLLAQVRADHLAT
jgi:hypothetical protein